MGRNSVVTKTGSTYKITQGTAEFSDYRRWYLNSSGKALAITDDYKIARVGADGIVEDTSDALITNDTAHITLCLNRDESIVYSITRWVGFSVTLRWFRVSDMADIGSQSLSVPDIDPLRAIISADEKIVWLGDNNTLYTMTIGGTIIDTIEMGLAVHSFCLGSNNMGFVDRLSTEKLWAFFIDGNGDITYEAINITSIIPTTATPMVDSFILDEYAYCLFNYIPTGLAKIIKIPLATYDNIGTYSTVDIASLYGVASCAQFNASGADNYATFSCTKDGRETVMQYNLTTGECLPARRVNYAEREIEYSNDAGKEIEKLGIDTAKANNCDWKGLLTSSKGATGSI